MSYQVLALKYRPQTFDDVVGQPHVTTTLSNAILQDRVAHAILFTGPRGTGKTTIARILAKAMNCKKGPTPLPCNTCKICLDIIEGHCTDVFEIDGASNNSVDQIRDLRENVTYMPSSANNKIYIIDEVHMLSTAAFNALLKTLEEPPEHVMFIFATTEVHKIPATILSRCQRHDLGRISLEMISKHLQDLCKREGFILERQSLDLIAQEADGSIRDALSLLDRVLSAAETKEIKLSSVLDSLGIQDLQIMHDISEAIFENNGARLIEIIERVNDSGIDLKKFYTNIIVHFRNLNVIKLCGEKSPSVNITDSEKEKIFLSVSSLSSGFINTILQILLDEESIIKYSSHTRTAVEMVLLRLIQINPGAQIDKIITKLDILARQIDSNQTGSNQAGSNQAGSNQAGSNQIRSNLADSKPLTEQHGFEPVQDSFANKSLHEKQDIHAVKESMPAHGYKPDLPSSPKQHKKSTPNTWQEFLNKIESSHPFIFTLFSKGKVIETSPDGIIVELKNGSSFDKKRLEKKKNELQNMCNQFLGKRLTIKLVPKKSKTDPETRSDQKKNKTKARQAAFNHPIVVKAQKMFDGEIINY